MGWTVCWSGKNNPAEITLPLLNRVAETQRPTLAFTLDGQPAVALQGDTLLTAVLTCGEQLRLSEFSGAPRAGFCMMGACQDCWMQLEDGRRVRACSTLVQAGMRVLTHPPAAGPGAAP
ncbi:(2Fe-2S)-binding protein [Bordetella hinzii]|uniref:(2Fe-2S)-binding protein n=1 Tax=Bordetella hinzii TaxID=103855 RepID=UPI001C8BEC97